MFWSGSTIWQNESVECIYLFIQLHTWGFGFNSGKYQQLEANREYQSYAFLSRVGSISPHLAPKQII